MMAEERRVEAWRQAALVHPKRFYTLYPWKEANEWFDIGYNARQPEIDFERNQRDMRHAAWLEATQEIDALKALLRDLKQGDCWCEVGVGNPMYRGHTETCERVRAVLGGRIAVRTITADVSSIIESVWDELANDCSETAVAHARGAIDMAWMLGALTDVERDGWLARIKQCPFTHGHFSRSWCAYCGEVSDVSDSGEPS